MDGKEMKELGLNEMEEVSGGAIWDMNGSERVLNEGRVAALAAKYKSNGLSSDAAYAAIRENHGGWWIQNNREQTLSNIDCRIKDMVEKVFNA